MTADRTPLSRTDLAGLLTEAAQSVSAILTAEYPTAPSRSYLHPVLGMLAAGPRVVGELNDRLEEFVAAEPRPTTPAGLFTLASYAATLGWLTESLAELTTAVDRICTRAGIPTEPRDPAVTTPDDNEFDFSFNALELAAIRTAAEAAGLAPDDYVAVLAESLLAASRVTDACIEISSSLLEDAVYVLDEATDHISAGDGPGSLPTLVRSLLARMEAAE
ncbi:hypothetical protein OG978_12640 [Streptomyces sp. NBC_01591]|uniref:hypothetical protein n=1 Tax=Streptomyces sp. NBC_01591 TaxID=2975888 RepID=UPI002DDB9295|nr:hypothetical protein [Streptomyces sp. NBC_01591]WSD68175.1 hypothetical protein OG978_12640 [Streptomyces sp. NBC_01591]